MHRESTVSPRKRLGTRVDGQDSSLIALNDTVSSGVKPQSIPSPLDFLPRAHAAATDATPGARRSNPRTRREKPGRSGHVSCSSIRKSTPSYLGSGPKYTAHVRGSFFLRSTRDTLSRGRRSCHVYLDKGQFYWSLRRPPRVCLLRRRSAYAATTSNGLETRTSITRRPI